MPGEQNSRDAFLIEEYKAISDQIIHWDEFFWSKSQFFLAIESGALFAVGTWLIDHQRVADATATFLSFAVFLNLFLSVTWLRTGRRNREFLNIRFEVGRGIEEHMNIPLLALYSYQDWIGKERKFGGFASHVLETSIPSAFMGTWLFVLYRIVTISELLPLLGLLDARWLAWTSFGLLFVCLSVMRSHQGGHVTAFA